MVQDKSPEQDTPEQDINVQEQFLPQTDPGPKWVRQRPRRMTPPPLRQNPPILAESAQPSAPDRAQLCAMQAGVTATMQQM